jgi:hypothetical protein
MTKFLYLAIVLSVFLVAIITKIMWLIIVVASLVVIDSILMRWKNIQKEHKAKFKVIDKKGSYQRLAISLIVYTLIYLQSIYMINENERIYMLIISIAMLLSYPISLSYQKWFLFNENDFISENKTILYSEIIRIREEADCLIIVINKGKEEVEIKRKLINSDLQKYIQSKIEVNAAQQ